MEDGESQTALLCPNQQGTIAESLCDLSSDIEVIDVQQQYHHDEFDDVMQLFGSPYVRSCSFWRKCLASVVLGFIIGCATAAFFALLLLFQINPLHNNSSINEHEYSESRGRDLTTVLSIAISDTFIFRHIIY